MEAFKFHSPTSVAVFAPSFSGKSTLTRKILENADTLFAQPPEIVVYCYKEWLPMFDGINDFTPRSPFKKTDGRMDTGEALCSCT